MTCKCTFAPGCDGNGNLSCTGCAGDYCSCLVCNGQEICDGCGQCARPEDDIAPWDEAEHE